MWYQIDLALELQARLQYCECFDLIHYLGRALIHLNRFQWDVRIFSRLAKNSPRYENV